MRFLNTFSNAVLRLSSASCIQGPSACVRCTQEHLTFLFALFSSRFVTEHDTNSFVTFFRLFSRQLVYNTCIFNMFTYFAAYEYSRNFAGNISALYSQRAHFWFPFCLSIFQNTYINSVITDNRHVQFVPLCFHKL